jgi:predicted RNase H-like HicB family nuclease
VLKAPTDDELHLFIGDVGDVSAVAAVWCRAKGLLGMMSLAPGGEVSLKVGDQVLRFPDCPGCQTFAEPGEDVESVAREALEGWLAVNLEDGKAPPKPA